MSLSTVADVRAFGKLPVATQLVDTIIQPHLDAAGRELRSLIGDYSGAFGDKLDDCKEAEQCICLAYLMPVLNTLYTEGTTTLQQELGGMNVRFHSQEDQQNLSDMWMQRARSRVAKYINSGTQRRPVSFHAI